MSKIIQRWLQQSIGIVLDMSPDVFPALVRDGKVLAELLYKHTLIEEELYNSICKSEESEICYRNLKLLQNPLKSLDLNIIDDILEDIADMKNNAALKLFYQMYFKMSDKNRLHFIAKQRTNEKFRPLETRFDVIAIHELQDDPSIVPDHPSSSILSNKQNLINWHKKYYQDLIRRTKKLRRIYTKYLEDKYEEPKQEVIRVPKWELKQEEDENRVHTKQELLEEYTYEELFQHQKKAEQLKAISFDEKSAKITMKRMKKKRREQLKENELKLHMQKTLLLQLWEKVISEQENQYEKKISHKILKQSAFEKQMVTKMFEVRQQKYSMMEHRLIVDKEIMKRREEEFLDQVFFKGHNMVEQRYSYYSEKKRILELHYRIYNEKLRLKGEKTLNSCADIVSDIIDMAFKRIDYKAQYDEEPTPRQLRDWAALFIKQLPLLDTKRMPIEIVEEIPEDFGNDLISELSLELMKQDTMDVKSFNDYSNFLPPWTLELVPEEMVDLHSIEMFENILGHLVHRILLTKYPKKAQSTPPDIPKVEIAACVQGITDQTALPVLKKILTQRMIKVIQLEDAINHCMDCYKKETIMEHVDDSLTQQAQKAADQTKTAPSTKGAKDKAPAKGAAQPAGPSKIDKCNQTPIIYPCQEIVLTPSATMGKTAYEMLNLGETLNDNILVEMFVEYLKTLKGIKGWVLINYPLDMVQAILLEEALTAKMVPFEIGNVKMTYSIGDYRDLITRNIDNDWGEDKLLVMRKSKLLPNPKPPRQEPYYDTFLTAFIIIKNPDNIPKQPNPYVVDDNPPDENPLEKFYTEQGCNYTMYCHSFDYASIKYLAKLIIGDYSIPPKTSVELFGDSILMLERDLSQTSFLPGKAASSVKKDSIKGPQPTRLSTSRPPSKTSSVNLKRRSKGGKSKSKMSSLTFAVQKEDKGVQVPEPRYELPPTIEVPETPPRPGEQYWAYIEVSIPEPLQIAMATLWENVEDIYINDLQQMLFIRRRSMDTFAPYLKFVMDHLKNFLERPDNKQTYLHQFQTMYNDIDEDLRSDLEMKAELQCRIVEFREKLWLICDNRMKEAEVERARIINNKWISIQICELTNNYIIAFQLELDRHVDTLQLLIDYYVGMVTKMPNGDPLVEKIILKKLVNETQDTEMDEELIESIANALLTPDEDTETTPFHQTILDRYEEALGIVNKLEQKSLSTIKGIDGYFNPKGAKRPASKPAGKNVKQLPKFDEPDEEVMLVGPDLVDEWTCAVNGEVSRVKIRLQLIKMVALNELSEIMSASKSTFHQLYNAIADKYQNEAKSVNTACEVLSQAVEAEVQIQPQLMFEGDMFVVEPNVLLFPNPLPPVQPIVECLKDDCFTISQLDVLIKMFLEIAPSGSIPERYFVYILEDMIVQDAEDGKPSMVPFMWKQLTTKEVSTLCERVFGKSEYICWKDFIVLNLMVSFPTEKELLATRNQFRKHDPDCTEVVMDYQYDTICFWFENRFDEECDEDRLRLKWLKQALFDLFCIDENSINYTALLLAFCKDENPVVGFAKALELSIGKLVCWEEEVGNSFVERIKQQREQDDLLAQEEDAAKNEALNDIKAILSSTLKTTVHLCDSVIVEDYIFPSPKIPEKNDGVDKIEIIFHKEISDHDEDPSNESFDNVSVGFESAEAPPLLYFLPFKALLTVLMASLPWHARVQSVQEESVKQQIEDLYTDLMQPEFNNAVLTHQLLNDKRFKDILQITRKFVATSPADVLNDILFESKPGMPKSY